MAQPPHPTASRPPPGHQRLLSVPPAPARPVIDGILDDSVWRQAALADRFWISDQQRWPAEQTEVLVTADSSHLYLGFRVHDSKPWAIEALQTRRDAGLGFDDQVAVELDPFLNRREISTFRVNAHGTQSDSFAAGRARQVAWKGDWKAAVTITEYGWSAELAIPFEILNISAGTETIGINFLRYHHRTAQWSRWADITVRWLPEEMGRLTGLRPAGGAKDKPWTLLPHVVVGRNIPDRSGKVRESLVTAGVDIRYEPRPDLTAVISVLPDFSQIERAVDSVDFNYNEKFRADRRPFFQEGAAYFGELEGGGKPSATSPYFYSNRLPDFEVGAKAFGRAGDGLQYGALVTRAAGQRTDLVGQLQQQFDPTHRLSALLVSTDRPQLRNQLYMLRGSGRQPSGLSYSFEAAASRTAPAPGDGSFLRGSGGWGRGFWSLGASVDRYSAEFFPANGLLARDLPDTRGANAYVSYFRDRPEGALREVSANLSLGERETGDGRLQRRKWYLDGAIELRAIETRLGVAYSSGPYRPVGTAPARWSARVFDDHYVQLSADFNTRSSRFGYGATHATGQQGGGDYRYTTAYGWAKPTVSTSISLSSERLESFGTFRQSVLNGTWDLTPRHTIAGRYIHAYYGNPYRLTYVWRARPDLDVFTVYDHWPDQPAQFSAKLLMTY
ncbi:carbohydrate binding family 9 domain-containing protein [Piscinibacter sakaiensis]|uniref:carbohydrate binding family 9 domain-containing protein n=1 Tax=Piscinibacter sakaiensis TaxID=1547922 RepID=UPI003AADD6AC